MQAKTLPQDLPEAERAGWTADAWCPRAGFSRATLYNLSPADWPHCVRIGKRLIITESPREYLSRLQARGGVTTIQPNAARTSERAVV